MQWGFYCPIALMINFTERGKPMGSMLVASGGGGDGSMSGLLSTFTQVFTWFITQIRTLVTTIIENPLLMLMTSILMCGAAIGLFVRLMKSV